MPAELRSMLKSLCSELEGDILLSTTRDQHLRAVLRVNACEEILKMLDSSHE